jgi:hypothetical protein
MKTKKFILIFLLVLVGLYVLENIFMVFPILFYVLKTLVISSFVTLTIFIVYKLKNKQ